MERVARPVLSEAAPPFAALDAVGLNLQAVFDWAALPPDLQAAVRAQAPGETVSRQLLLIGHRGRDFWQALQRRGMHGSDPVDAFVQEQVSAWAATALAGRRWGWLYPGPCAVGLQRLGALAGWHHPSPFWVGVNEAWGSWFAYRALLWTEAEGGLAPTQPAALDSPCLSCADTPCVRACPAQALAPLSPSGWLPGGTGAGGSSWPACRDHRLAPDSVCRDRCQAREACPVGPAFRYSEAQTAYHSLHSLQHL